MRRYLRHCCSLLWERFAYWSGLNAVFYRLNRKAKRIITFHHVFPDEMMRMRKNDGLAHSLSDFFIIVKRLGQRYAFSLDLEDAKSVTLTFDDGYQSQYACAFKALTSQGGGGGSLLISS